MTTTSIINGIDITKHFGLIGMAVRSSRWAIGASLEWDDLFQAGFFGLRRAAEKFDPAHGCTFGTYAGHWVRHYIRRAAMNEKRTIRVPIWLQERCRASARELPPDTVSLDAPLRADDKDAATWLDLAAGAADPGADLETAQRRETVEEALALLPERLRGVLEARFWRNETLAEIGERLDLSRERVRQLERDALQQLRHTLKEAQ